MTRYFTVVLYTLFVALASARADTLTLRNGTSLTGYWIGVDAQQVTFSVNDQIVSFPRSEVLKITFAAITEAVVPPPIPTIAIGQTTDQVTRTLGQPKSIMDVGTKKVYIYAIPTKMKITFNDGKVTDVE